MASSELKKILTLFEAYRSMIVEDGLRNSFFDAESSVYDVAIDFEHSRLHDDVRAFGYAEWSMARSLLDAGAGTVPVNRNGVHDISLPVGLVPGNLDSVQRALPEEAQVIEYSVLQDKVLIWLVSKDRVEAAVADVSADKLTQRVIEYNKAIADLSDEGAEDERRLAKDLYRLLIQPIQSLLDQKKEVCVVPDKILNHLSFCSLLSPDTGRYLIQDYVLEVSPSANVFNQCSAIARRLGPMDHERALIIGDPSIDHAMFSLPELPSAFREAELIGTLYNPATVLTGDMVRKADVCVGMGRADVIHLAMHYVVDERSPMLSEFLLAKQKNNMGKGSLEEEVLRAYELYGLRLPHTRLVVLAACQTAVERFYGGEGALSISRPFLMAGVPLVLSTLWSVDSTNTVDLMVAFHTYRKTAGLTTVAALRQSQLDTLNGPDERSRRPYYWAAFVVMGGHAKF